jgi:hypothetical protein
MAVTINGPSKVIEGDTVTLEAMVDGSPPTTALTWTKDDEPIDVNRVSGANNAELQIPDASTADGGTYSATSGTETGKFGLEVEPKPAESTDRDTASDAWWRGVALRAAGFLLVYWIAALLLPLRWDLWVGLLIFVTTVAVTQRRSRRNRNRPEGLMLAWGVFGLALSLNTLTNWWTVEELSDDQRVSLALGGTAIVVLAGAAGRYISVKAAASMVIVVLFIGLVAFPDLSDELDEDIVKSLVGWMAGILGVVAVAEAAENGKKAQESANATTGTIASLSAAAQSPNVNAAQTQQLVNRMTEVALPGDSTPNGNPLPSDF